MFSSQYNCLENATVLHSPLNQNKLVSTTPMVWSFQTQRTKTWEPINSPILKCTGAARLHGLGAGVRIQWRRLPLFVSPPGPDPRSALPAPLGPGLLGLEKESLGAIANIQSRYLHSWCFTISFAVEEVRLDVKNITSYLLLKLNGKKSSTFWSGQDFLLAIPNTSTVLVVPDLQSTCMFLK